MFSRVLLQIPTDSIIFENENLSHTSDDIGNLITLIETQMGNFISKY